LVMQGEGKQTKGKTARNTRPMSRMGKFESKTGGHTHHRAVFCHMLRGRFRIYGLIWQRPRVLVACILGTPSRDTVQRHLPARIRTIRA